MPKQPKNPYSHIPADDFNQHTDSTDPGLLHHIATHPETSSYDMRSLAENPHIAPETAGHIHNLINEKDEDGDHVMTSYGRSKLAQNLYANPKVPPHLIKDMHDKMPKQDFLDDDNHSVSFHPNIPIDHVTHTFKNHTNNFEDMSHSNASEAVGAYAQHPGATADHMQPFVDHKDSSIARAALKNPKLTLDQQKKVWNNKENDWDDKQSILSNHDTYHLSPEMVQHAHDEMRTHLDSLSEKMKGAKKEEKEKIGKEYDSAHSAMKQAIKHPSLPKELINHYLNSPNPDFKSAAIHNPSFDYDKLNDLAASGDNDAIDAFWDRPESENASPDMLRKLHGVIPPNKDKYMSTHQRELLANKNTPDDVLKERADVGTYAAQKVLERKDLSPEVLKHLVNHKNKTVAIDALKHKNVNEDVVNTALKRKMSDVNKAASLHPMAPKDSKYEKFLKDSKSAHAGLESGLEDDPTFVRQAADKFPDDSNLQMKLLRNKHTSPEHFNSVMGKFLKSKEAEDKDPENSTFRERVKLHDQADDIVKTQQGNLDKEGKNLVSKLLPDHFHKIDHLSPEEIKSHLDHWNGKDQEQANSSAANLFHHPNINSDIARNILTGTYGKVEPHTGSSYYNQGNKLSETIHKRPEIFNTDVIKHGLQARPEFTTPDMATALASAPQFRPDSWDELIESHVPGPTSTNEQRANFNGLLSGMHRNPNLDQQSIKKALENKDWHEDVLKNPSLTDEDLLAHASHPNLTENFDTHDIRNVAQAIKDRGLSAKALTQTPHEQMAKEIIGKQYGGDKQKLFDKYLPSIIKKNPNPDVSAMLLNDHLGSWDMDEGLRHKMADDLADHPNVNIRSAAFKHMSGPKKEEYMAKHGKSDPNIIANMDRDKIRDLKITKDMPHEAVSAAIENPHSDYDHMNAAVDHSPEAAMTAVKKAVQHNNSAPYIEEIKKGYRTDKKAQINAQNKRSLEDHADLMAKSREVIQKAMKNYPDNDALMNHIVDKSTDQAADLMMKPEVSENVKAKLLSKRPLAWGRNALEQFKDTKNYNMVHALTQAHIDNDFFTHLTKNATEETGPLLAQQENHMTDEGLNNLLKLNNEDVNVNLVDNSSTPKEVKDKLLKDPNVLLRSSSRGATPEHLDNLLDTNAEKDPQLYKKIAEHGAATDDLRSKIIKTVGSKLDELQKASVDGGKDADDLSNHPDFKHYQDAIREAVESTQNKKFHKDAQYYIGKYGDENSVKKFLNMKNGRQIDEKAAREMANRFHDGVRSNMTEQLLNTKFKDPALSHKLIEDASLAGNFDEVANHIERNKLPDETLNMAYDHLKNSSNEGSHGKPALLKQLSLQGDSNITNELIDHQPNLVGIMSKNRRVDPAKFKEGFHKAMDHFVENNNTSISEEGLSDILNNPHIDSDDIAKTYKKIGKLDGHYKFNKLRHIIAHNPKTDTKTLETMYDSERGNDIEHELVQHPKFPHEKRMGYLSDSIKQQDSRGIRNAARNPNARLKDFDEAASAHGTVSPIRKGEYLDQLTENTSAHPDDLTQALHLATQDPEIKNVIDKNSMVNQLIKNTNTPESLLDQMHKNGDASVEDLMEHPTVGGKMFRSLKHEFPEDVPGLKRGNELNEIQYKPKQEKYQQVIGMMPKDGMDWATFKKEQPKLAADPDVQKMFTSQPKQKLTQDAGKEYLDKLPGNNFHLSYRTWTGMQRHNPAVNQLVMQVNNSQQHDEELKKDPKLFKLYKMAQAASTYSGHPTGPHSVAWSRIDTSNPDHWFIDEAQSDMNSSLSASLREVEETGNAASIQRKYGISLDEANQLLPKLQDVLRNWEKAALNGAIELAKRHGVKRISMHSGDSKTAFNKGPGEEVTNKYNKIYNDAANAVGLDKKVPYSSVPGYDTSKKNTFVWTKNLMGDDDGEDTKKSVVTFDIKDLLKSTVQHKK